MTPEDMQALKEAAEKATKGHWKSAMTGRGMCVVTVNGKSVVDTICQWAGGCPARTDNIHYIAAANPDAILSLIIDNERMRAALKPFADAADHESVWTWPDSAACLRAAFDWPDSNGKRIGLKVGDLRNAAKAYKGDE